MPDGKYDRGDDCGEHRNADREIDPSDANHSSRSLCLAQPERQVYRCPLVCYCTLGCARIRSSSSSDNDVLAALLPYLATVVAGPAAWDADETIRRAIDIRDGTIKNPKILSFQGRSKEFPHHRL